MSLRAPHRAGLLRALVKRDVVPTAALLGVEHEYSVWSDERWLDARDLFDRRPPPGVRVHPTETRRFLLDSGVTLHADDHVAEVAAPPVAAATGASHDLRAWMELGREELLAALPDGVEIRGESTHLSVSMPDRLNEAASLLYAQTFAPAAMLLMDLPSSPGLLVRPRPGRLELCGEFVSETALRAAVLFALGSARACALALESGDLSALPRALELELEPGRLRFGWYVDRSAFGGDLYSELRAARLRSIDGSELTAGDHLLSSTEIALEHLGDVSAEERKLLARIARGDLGLPAEGEPIPDKPAGSPRPSIYTGLTRPFVREGLKFETVLSTWEFTAFRVSNGHSAILPVPAERLDSFRANLESGRSERWWQEEIATAAQAPVLRTLDQARSGRIFKDVEAGAKLLPTDYMGVGNVDVTPIPSAGRLLATSSVARSFMGGGAVVSQVAIASDTNEVKGTKPKKPCLPGWAAAVLIALPAIAGVLTATFVGGNEQPVTAAQPTTAASPSAVVSPTSSVSSPVASVPPSTVSEKDVVDAFVSVVHVIGGDPAVSEAFIPAEGFKLFDFTGQVIPDNRNWYDAAVPELIAAADVSLPRRDMRRMIDCGASNTACTPQWADFLRGPGRVDLTILGWGSSGPLLRTAPDGGSWFFNFSFDTPAKNAPDSEQGYEDADCYAFVDPTTGNLLADHWNRAANEPQQVFGPVASVFTNDGVTLIFGSNHPCASANEMRTQTFAFDQGQQPSGISINSPQQGMYTVEDRPNLNDLVTTVSQPTPLASQPVSSPLPTSTGSPTQAVTTSTGGGFPYWVLIVTGLALSGWGAVMIAEDCWQRRRRLGL